MNIENSREEVEFALHLSYIIIPTMIRSMKMSSSTKLCGWNRGLNCSTSTSIGSWAQSFVTTIILNDHHTRFILPLLVGSQTHLKSPNHSHLDNVIFDQRKVVRSRRPSEAFPHPVAFWCQKDSSSAHCQVLAILQLEGERSSKVLRYRRDVHSNADGIIVYSKANGLGVHSKVTVRIRPKPSAPHAVIFDLDTSHPAKASITMYVRCRPPHRTSGQSYNRHVNPYPASTLRYPAGSPRLFAQGLGHP